MTAKNMDSKIARDLGFGLDRRLALGPVHTQGCLQPRPQPEKSKTNVVAAMARSSQRRLKPAAHSTACSASPSDPLSQHLSIR
jgi:hypothetical protein